MYTAINKKRLIITGCLKPIKKEIGILEKLPNGIAPLQIRRDVTTDIKRAIKTPQCIA